MRPRPREMRPASVSCWKSLFAVGAGGAGETGEVLLGEWDHHRAAALGEQRSQVDQAGDEALGYRYVERIGELDRQAADGRYQRVGDQPVESGVRVPQLVDHRRAGSGWAWSTTKATRCPPSRCAI